MTISFSPDLVLPKDPAGFGQWRMGHFLEHGAIREKCAALTTPINIVSLPILSWKDEPQFVKQWLVAHETMHEQIRAATNVSGTDLSLVDWSEDEQFMNWMDIHAQEHREFREILGIT